MATKQEFEENDPASPEHYSGDENLSEDGFEPEEPEAPPENKTDVAKLLEQLKNSGALVKKPAPVSEPEEFRCVKCDIDFPDWPTQEDHLLEHVTLPTVLIDKLPSDDESEPDFEPGDEWSDEESAPKRKIDVSEILKNKYLSIKKSEPIEDKPPDALSKLANLGGFTIKKNNTPKKEEQPESDDKNELMKKLGNLGGLKLKLQATSQGNQSSFKIINGLNDFNPDDDEEFSDKEEADRSTESEDKDKESSDSSPTKPVPQPEFNTPVKAKPNVQVTKVVRIIPQKAVEKLDTTPNMQAQQSNSTNVLIKNEPEDDVGFPSQNLSDYQSDVKSECPTPPLHDDSTATPIKKETEDYPNTSAGVSITEIVEPPIEPKTEKTDPVAIIEINGDSNDEDDDCCVVSATPAADIKPKIENVNYPPPSNTYTGQAVPMSSQNILSSRLSGSTSSYTTEKQHSFNWNAPDQKPEVLEKSADAIFESLLASSNHKKESISEASEYISLDNLHTCEVCNTRFTDISLLENHRRSTGHSTSLISSSRSALLPSYGSSSSLLSSLLPVKQLADQVGRLSSVSNSGGPFTHQQNMIINIQAYPGQGMVAPQQQYAGYQGQQQGANYGNNMYRMPGQNQPGTAYMGSYGQYAPQTYPAASGFMAAPQGYSQASPLQGMQQQVYGSVPPVSQMSAQPGQMPPGQIGSNNIPPGQMAPGQMVPGQQGANGQLLPGQTASPQQFAPASSPNSMKPPPPPGNIRIQNVQSFTGQSPGAVRGGSPLRGGIRPRMPGVRPGMRPTVRPGVQVQGGVRGGKPGVRMPIKRPGGAAQGPPNKKRMDMLIPGKHDNEDCTVMAMQKQRDGLPMIHSVQGSKDKLSFGSGLSITKKPVNKEASGMANLLASRGIMVKQKAKSRSPSPERPLPHIPNLGAGVSIKHSSKNSQFSIPESRVGGSMISCRICKKMFMNSNSLQVHMTAAHPGSKVPLYRCEECPASYPKSAQLHHHRRVFHNVSGPDRELGLPVVDLSQEENLKKLSDLGIYSFIPLANREQASGCFGIPVISVHNMNNGIVRGLTALGADGLLSLGPLKPLPNT